MEMKKEIIDQDQYIYALRIPKFTAQIAEPLFYHFIGQRKTPDYKTVNETFVNPEISNYNDKMKMNYL